ncbi:hypothetical protein [Corallococcus llansteffanensis]|uniref:Uncharacterized protein n=1 Tax=Corallococcus llansteffanensis TaxID=2316731 RepID=A0A3A8NYX6_9BACT|nr:hypothetical protein [Corallococcus llansteffanensis]RKH48729.1 hypothetical protein D7V93_32830 [Corallococcus llansteffanensis]
MARLLTVEGVSYRWRLQGRSESLGGLAHRLLTVMWAEATRQALHVWIRHDDPWLHVGEVDVSALETRSVGPGLVARVVTLARAAGWEPEKRGPTLKFLLEEDARLVALDVPRGG